MLMNFTISSIFFLLSISISSSYTRTLFYNAVESSSCSRLYTNNRNVETYYGTGNDVTDYTRLTSNLLSLFDEKVIQSYSYENYTPLPPMIHHIYVADKHSINCNMVEFIVSQTSLPKSYVKELLHIGAIYLSSPPPPSTTTSTASKYPAKALPFSSTSSVQSPNDRNVKTHTKPQSKSLFNLKPELTSISKLRPKRVETENIRLHLNSYLRVHVFPRRHFSIYKIKNWSNYILSTHKDEGSTNNDTSDTRHNNNSSVIKSLVNSTKCLVFVNKQGGIPTLETVDNRIENLRYQVSTYLNKNLYCLGRLDTCTSGIVGFATSSAAASEYSQRISQRNVIKKYKALVYTAAKSSSSSVDNDDSDEILPKVGLLNHLYKKHADNQKGSKPTLLRPYNESFLSSHNDEWQIASLEILSIQPMEFHDINLHSLGAVITADSFVDNSAHRNGSGSGSGSTSHSRDSHNQKGKTIAEEQIRYKYYELDISLITGRSHQIRLQCAAIWLPVVGDSRYAPVTSLLYDDVYTSTTGLAPTTASVSVDDDDRGVSVTKNAKDIFGKDPDCIALQCYYLSFPNSDSNDESSKTDKSTHSITVSIEKPFWRK